MNSLDSEISQQVYHHRKKTSSQICRVFSWSVGFVFAFVGLMVLSTFLFRKFPLAAQDPHTYQRLHCGNTTDEAISLGCEFDLLSYSWTPGPCLDRETSEGFKDWLLSPDRQFSPWPFYADREGKEWVPDAESLSMRTGGVTWTTQEEHLGHCTFLMRRLHKVASNEARLNSRYGQYGHTVHCTKEILRGFTGPVSYDKTQLDSTFGVSFESC